jgi:hypothetical protein
LVVDSTYKAGTSEYPIELVVLDLANSIDLTDDTEDNGAEAATADCLCFFVLFWCGSPSRLPL